MARSKPTLKEPARKTLEDAIDDLHRRSGCHHEDDIRGEILSEVKHLLRDRGMLDVLLPHDANGEACTFCSSKEIAIVHKGWCVRA